MQALVLNSPGQMKVVDDFAMPQAKPGWAVVRVRYAGVCGSDLPRMMITGSYDHPKICGHEFMGEIFTPATDSTKFKKGDKVTVLPLVPCKVCEACLRDEFFHCKQYKFLGSRIHGGFAEYCLTPEENLYPIPAGADERVGAFIEPLLVGRHLIKRSGFKAGDSVLVLGAGPIGILTALWLKHLKAGRVVVAGRSAESLATAREVGLAEVYSTNDKSFTESAQTFDHCYEAAGSNQALATTIEKTRAGGTITVLGRDKGDLQLSLKHFETFMRKEITMNGCWGYDVPDAETLNAIFTPGVFPINTLITKETNLSEGPSIIPRMHNKDGYFCKVLFKMHN